MTAVRPLSLGFLVWAFAFVGFGGTTLLSVHPVARLAGVAVFGVPVVLWAMLRWRRPVDRLDVAALVAVVTHLVVSFASLDPSASLEMSAVVVAYAAVYGLARALATDDTLRRMFTTATVVALVFWLVILAITWTAEKVLAVQGLGWPPPVDSTQPWVWGSVNTPPVLAMLAGPFLAWLPPSPARRLLLVIWVVAAAVVVPLSVGRAAWLGIAVALITAEVLLGFPTLRRVGIPQRLAGRVALNAGGFIAAGMLVLLATDRLGGLAAALDSRLRLWDQALSLFAADPFTGAGPSTFGWARLSHIADYVDRVAAKEAHSVPLQTLSDGGILLAVSALLVAGAWVTLLVERWPGLDMRRRLALAALAGYAAFALLDDLSFLPSITVLLVVLACWAIPTREPEPAERTPCRLPSWLVPAGLVVVGLVTAPSLAAMTTARLDAARGRDAAIRGDWPAALQAFEHAAATHPANAQLWMSVGLAAARSASEADAMSAYARARDLNPGDPRPWGALAALTPDEPAATQLLDQAARRSNDPRYAYRLGTRLLRAGDNDAAARAFAISVTLWPDWWAVVPRELWPDIRAALPDAIDRVGPIGGAEPREAAWNADLAMGELGADAAPPWQALALARDGHVGEAVELLGSAASSVRVDQARAAVARMACDREAHDRAVARLRARQPFVQRGDHPVAAGPAGVYRDPELGDYQPITDVSVPATPAWPEGLVELPDCDW